MILTVADVKLYCGESHGYPNRSFELWALSLSLYIENMPIFILHIFKLQELLGVTIPLINFHAIKRKFGNLFKTEQIGELNEKVDFNIHTKCANCLERPTLPHYIAGCNHIYCYYCLFASKKADANFQCNICNFKSDRILRV